MPPMAKRFLPSQEWSGCVRGIVGEYDVVCRHDTVRFLLSQEWSAWGRGDCWRIWRLCGRRRRAATMPYLPIDSLSPVDHSCESRNLSFICDNAASIFLLLTTRTIISRPSTLHNPHNAPAATTIAAAAFIYPPLRLKITRLMIRM